MIKKTEEDYKQNRKRTSNTSYLTRGTSRPTQPATASCITTRQEMLLNPEEKTISPVERLCDAPLPYEEKLKSKIERYMKNVVQDYKAPKELPSYVSNQVRKRLRREKNLSHSENTLEMAINLYTTIIRVEA